MYHTIGVIEKNVLGIRILIKNSQEECINEAKRVGLMIDRISDLQLRKGDTLLLYISKHIQE